LKISIRLKAVADMVTVGNRIADIGTDHGYVPIYLIKNNISPTALAMDINKGPLDKAIRNIKAFGLEDRITTRQSNGLDELNEGETDTVIISGMGGQLIIEILNKNRTLLETIDELVLLPHREVYEVRQYLHSIGYAIVCENVVKDEGKYYQIIKAKKGSEPAYSQLEYMYGRNNLNKLNETLKELLIFEKKKYESLLSELIQKDTQSSLQRQEELKHLIELTNRGLSYYEM